MKQLRVHLPIDWSEEESFKFASFLRTIIDDIQRVYGWEQFCDELEGSAQIELFTDADIPF